MSERPILSLELDYDTFIQYYYLKEELISFCRNNGLSTVGCKEDISKRIFHFLKTGDKLTNLINKRNKVSIELNEISLDTIIEDNFVCSEKHRAFFKSVIGDNFSFNVIFQKYLKNNAGKSYSEAVTEWYRILEDKKNNKGKSNIDSQFEYNTYIRDFFNDNKDKSFKEAITCWKYKKSLAGNNKYDKQDLSVLNSKTYK